MITGFMHITTKYSNTSGARDSALSWEPSAVVGFPGITLQGPFKIGMDISAIERWKTVKC
jgi:hypothetical protein